MLSIDEEYLLGCQKRDGIGCEKNAEAAIQHFEASDSYFSHFALGEMYQYGIPDGFQKDPLKAAAAFLNALESFESDPFTVITAHDISYYSHTEITLEQINQLLSWAKIGDPEALYQLAFFYEAELEVLNGSNLLGDSRKIEATKEELVRWMEACYLAATKLSHPRAALQLVQLILNKQFQTPISLDDLVKYSRVAVDPHNERFTPRSMGTHVYLRGTAPVIFDVTLKSGLPSDLYVHQPINQGKSIAGLYANSVKTQSQKSLLPLLHKAFNATKVSEITLASNEKTTTQLTPEQIREQRIKLFASKKPESKNVTQPSVLSKK